MNAKFVIFFIFLLNSAIICERTTAQEKRETSVSRQGVLRAERKVENGYSISVRNAFGHITITGWERDTVEASAVNDFDQQPVKARIIEDTGDGRKVLIVVIPQVEYSGKGVVSLFVKVPRSAELQPVRTKNGAVTVSNIEGRFSIETIAGDVKVNGTGSIEIQTKSGNIIAENVKGSFNAKSDKSSVDIKNIGGRVDLIIGNSTVLARNIDGDVSIMSIDSPQMNLQCIKGHVEIDDTSSLISLAAIEDDIYVTSSTGEVRFSGEIKGNKRYRLKTLSGVVSMSIPESSVFFAAIRTYKGEVFSDFNLQKDASLSSVPSNRQLQGTYGTGPQAGIELDSFSGAARLKRLTTEVIKKCER